jgi:hypothetical protein
MLLLLILAVSIPAGWIASAMVLVPWQMVEARRMRRSAWRQHAARVAKAEAYRVSVAALRPADVAWLTEHGWTDDR